MMPWHCLLRGGHVDYVRHERTEDGRIVRIYLSCQRCDRATLGWGPAVPGWQDGISKPRVRWRRPLARKVRLLRLAKSERKRA